MIDNNWENWLIIGALWYFWIWYTLNNPKNVPTTQFWVVKIGLCLIKLKYIYYTTLEQTHTNRQATYNHDTTEDEIFLPITSLTWDTVGTQVTPSCTSTTPENTTKYGKHDFLRQQQMVQQLFCRLRNIT